MSEVFTFNFPGATIRGRLYRDAGATYLLGDVMQLILPTGFTIDVGWEDDGDLGGPFLIVVYQEFWEDHFVSLRAWDADEVAERLEQLAKEFNRPVSTPSCSGTIFKVSKAIRLEEMYPGNIPLGDCFGWSTPMNTTG
jgi:hypothetical protein